MENMLSPYKSSDDKSNAEQIPPYSPVPADKWLRFFNLVIDFVACLGVANVIHILIAFTWGQAGIDKLESYPLIVIGIPIVLGYYIFFEGLSRRTIGKLMTGTRVVGMHGEKPGFRQILKRSIARLIPFEAVTFLGNAGRGWHDSLASTYVVKSREFYHSVPD
jgi:uncharacterized RDD family membrane protein YckC